MATFLPSEITQAIKDNIERFSVKPEYRVLMMTGLGGSYISGNPVGDGEYNTSNGEYTLLEKVWIKKVTSVNGGFAAGYKEIRIEYQNSSGDWVLWHSETTTGSSPSITINTTIWADKIRVLFYKDSDESDIFYPSLVFVQSEKFFDVTDYTGGITLETNTSGLGSEFNLPFTSIELVNNNGQWNKYKSFSLPTYSVVRSSGAYIEEVSLFPSSLVPYKKRGTRFVVLIKFRGTDYADSDWIMKSSFYSRKWSNSSVSGESAWNAKSKIKSPTIEGAEFYDIINDYLVRDEEKNLLVQNDIPNVQQVITVADENIGEVVFEPDVPNTLFEGEQILSHCADSEFQYYAVREGTAGALTDMGIGVHVYRRRVGDEAELLGTIRCRTPYRIGEDAATWGFRSFANDKDAGSSLFGGQVFSGYVPHVFKMAVDDTHLYIPVVDYHHGNYQDIIAFPEQVRGYSIGQSCIYKLPKEGGGIWTTLFWPGIADTNPLTQEYRNVSETLTFPNVDGTVIPKNIPQPYAQPYIYSAGFTQFLTNGTDPLWWNNSDRSEIFLGCELIQDGGVEKLLVCVQKKAITDPSANPLTEFVILEKDWNPLGRAGDINTYADITRTSHGFSESREWVVCVNAFNDQLNYASFQDAATPGANYISVISRDAAGDFHIDRSLKIPYGTNGITLSLSFYIDGLYQSGVGYDWYTEYKSEDIVGIQQLYKNFFQLNGYNLIHFQHDDRNEWLSNSIPSIKVAGGDPSHDLVRYGLTGLDGELFTTPSYQLNLRTGDLILRQVLPSGDAFRITASYDFVLSVLFFKADSDSRLSESVIGKLQEVSSRTNFINEAGMLEEMKYLESQSIPIANVINPYNIAVSTDPANLEIERTHYTNSYTSGIDQLTAFEFTAEFDGVIEMVRIPIRVEHFPGQGTFSAPVNGRLYLAPDVNLTRDYPTWRDKVINPPVSGDIVELTDGADTFDILILQNRITIPGDGSDTMPASRIYSEYYWVSANVAEQGITVEKGRTYCIILREPYSAIMDNFTSHQCLCKGAEEGAPADLPNKIAWNTVVTSQPMSTVDGGTWKPPEYDTGGGTNYDYTGLIDVVVKKTAQELKSVDIIDSLNPVIASGFRSLQGGDDSTFSLKSDDYNTTYVRDTDYTLTYVGGKFILTLLTLGIDDSVIAQWYESKTALLKLGDLLGDGVPTLSEQSQHGVDTQFLRTTLTGQRLRPADVSVRSRKQYDMYPGLGRHAEEDSGQIKNMEVVAAGDWNDNLNEFDALNPGADPETKRFSMDFNDPFVVGSTAYRVRRGKGKAGDNWKYGQLFPSITPPIFYEVSIAGSGITDLNYHVMLGFGDNIAYKSFRIAVESDWIDMVEDGGVFVQGTTPTTPADIKTLDHFYIKHMNGVFGISWTEWFAYESELALFFVNRDGNVIEDPNFSDSDPRNPHITNYPGKTISVTVGAVDLVGNPLFEGHGVAADPVGYDSDFDEAIYPNKAAKITRVAIRTLGVDVIYDGYGDKKKFLSLEVAGYPINKVLKLKADKKLPGADHADARAQIIDNEYIQHQAIADRKVFQNSDFWGTERLDYNKKVLYHPMLRPGTVIIVESELEGIDNELFVSLQSRHSLPSLGDVGEVLSSDLGKLLQI
jgi:hypothetical protein